ncbi:MAG: UV DNA damage repair endonuclease UvsE [Nanohaloarchaea archaeon SW_7_43_1]|nr:MAG: UV DNA damage repair endonuclease UvsE [Nanohaloarchaea archaeon SW_7_43_1]
MDNLGYADRNMHLRDEGIRVNRGMQKKTFNEKGLDYVAKLGEQNCRDLEKIVKWKNENDINFYRITSEFLPWHNKYEFKKLPNHAEIDELLDRIGSLAQENNQRLTFHPGHFVKLASPTERVAQKAIDELDFHGKVLDIMGAEKTTYNSINIHIGAHYQDKEETAKRFCKNYRKLSKSAQERLTVENDDKESLWSVSELIESVHDEIGIPVVYDRLHHRFSGRNLTHEEALKNSVETWDQKPIMHYSESRDEHGKEDSRPQSHSDDIKGPIKTFGQKIYVMIEAKNKEKALLNYRNKP